MDFITALPNSAGKTVIMVVIDRLSIYAHFSPLRSPITAISVAQTFVNDVCKHHGITKSIVIEIQFSLVVSGKNCFVCRMTPFEAGFTKKPPTILRYEQGTSHLEALDQELLQRDNILQQFKTNLHQAQLRMQNQANKNQREKHFDVGDYVLVRLQPYKQASVAQRCSHKFGRRYCGPYLGTRLSHRLPYPNYPQEHNHFADLWLHLIGESFSEKERRAFTNSLSNGMGYHSKLHLGKIYLSSNMIILI
ncbi:uncharacterized protein LOC143850439 [Tasmannia lanceolata]|uniref:uncharacterized protein LOC143850439 n=1 Tax=Tasmannia lanceolata TaxID=3420 RepID=UPI0040643DD4